MSQVSDPPRPCIPPPPPTVWEPLAWSKRCSVFRKPELKTTEGTGLFIYLWLLFKECWIVHMDTNYFDDFGLSVMLFFLVCFYLLFRYMTISDEWEAPEKQPFKDFVSLFIRTSLFIEKHEESSESLLILPCYLTEFYIYIFKWYFKIYLLRVFFIWIFLLVFSFFYFNLRIFMYLFIFESVKPFWRALTDYALM